MSALGFLVFCFVELQGQVVRLVFLYKIAWAFFVVQVRNVYLNDLAHAKKIAVFFLLIH